MPRNVKPPPFTFERFPEDDTCPVCNTNDDGPTVLIAIDGTGDGNIAEAQCFHLECALAKQFNPKVGIIYRRISDNDIT